MNVEYVYKPATSIAILVAAFFGSCAVFLPNLTTANGRGLILNRVFEFTAREASIFYGVLAVGMSLLAAMAVFGFAASVLSKRTLVLTSTNISMPPFWLSRQRVVVPFNEIVELQVLRIHWQRYLIVRHRTGEIAIAKSMLPNAAAFDDLCAALARGANLG